MTDKELARELAPAAAICLVLIVLYAAFGLMTVVVTAALFDVVLRGLEDLETRRAHAPRSATADTPKRM